MPIGSEVGGGVTGRLSISWLDCRKTIPCLVMSFVNQQSG